MRKEETPVCVICGETQVEYDNTMCPECEAVFREVLSAETQLHTRAEEEECACE